MKAANFLLSSALLLAASAARAENTLLFLELQGVGGYSSAEKSAVWHSMSAMEPMQKTSAGFDLLRRLSGSGTLALQARLAYDPDAHDRLELQLYNAYYRARAPWGGYAWAGHNRTAAGLESYLDTHGALLQALPMYGYGFDRDWGAGASRDFDWGDAALSLTTGSGMRLRAAGGWLASARTGLGVLNSDNRTLGLYASAGEIPGIMGYKIMDGQERPYSAFGADYALLWDRWELRADLRAGEKAGMHYSAGLARLGLNLLEESRLKLEGQAVYDGMAGMEGWALAAGASYAATPYLTLRAMFEYDEMAADRRAAAQVYYYIPL